MDSFRDLYIVHSNYHFDEEGREYQLNKISSSQLLMNSTSISMNRYHTIRIIPGTNLVVGALGILYRFRKQETYIVTNLCIVTKKDEAVRHVIISPVLMITREHEQQWIANYFDKSITISETGQPLFGDESFLFSVTGTFVSNSDKWKS